MVRMPLIQESVTKFFQREPCRGVHPDEVVALGASIQGTALTQGSTELLLLDVTPHSLGIMISGGYFHELIGQNTTVPTNASHIFTTVRDNQTSVKILVLQGESDKAAENELLGEFILTGLEKASRGQVEVDVTLSISADGIVSVAARDLKTGREQSITVTATSGLTEEELSTLVSQSHEYMLDVKKNEDLERGQLQVRKVVEEVEALFPEVRDVMSGTSFGRDAISKAEAVVARAKLDLEGRDVRALAEVQESLDRTVSMFRGVVTKTKLS
jgi:molecular chaperone DnaK